MSSECADLNDTVALDTLLRHVVPVVNSLPYELGVDLLRQAYLEFARRTELLSSAQEILPQKEVADYELIPPDGYEVYKVRKVGIGNDNITQPNANYWYTVRGVAFQVVGVKYIVLQDAPSADSDSPFTVSYTVVPVECATRIPRELSVAFGKKIALKALADALCFKNKPWHDPNLALKFEREFNIGVQAARNLNLMNRGGATMTARTKRWA